MSRRQNHERGDCRGLAGAEPSPGECDRECSHVFRSRSKRAWDSPATSVVKSRWTDKHPCISSS
ncbi:hypothetical protein Micbo1qcDRAFT_164820, partial [Microdochium bolleyi]